MPPGRIEEDMIDQQVMLEAFFDELRNIEKTAMMQKASAGFLGQVVGGFRRIGKKGLGNTMQRMGKAYNVGAGRAQRLGQNTTLGGLGSMMRTREGKALAVGAGGAALGAGALGYGMRGSGRPY